MLRSSDGKMRIDTGSTSVITDPRAQQAIVLDHIAKTARVMPLAPSLPQPGMPAIGGAAPAFKPPAMPAMHVQDLGKNVIGGQAVDGKRYIVPAPPATPQAPQMPQAPPVPQAPTTVEVWTSSKLGLPVLTQVTGPFGQQTCSCKTAPVAEPHPSLFQVPPGYKC